MTVIRSTLFAVIFYVWSTLLSPFYVPLMLLPRRGFWFMAWVWVQTCLFLVEHVAGIRYEVRGRENLPPGPFIIASKHQSAWDTLIYNKLFPDCAYVLKRELFWFPFFGWFLWKVGMVGIDRSGGAKTLKLLVQGVRECLADGRPIIIFPQGTRTAPGADRKYLPGVSAIYAQSKVSVVPVALNSGMFWPRRRFLKRPGAIVVEILPAIAPGLDRRTFERMLRERIEPATRRLESEAADRFGIEYQAPEPVRTT
jgi:1-acyl-sn-glycerol-3-phosphate acyltransferase